MNYEPRPDRSVQRRDEDGIDDAGRRLAADLAAGCQPLRAPPWGHDEAQVVRTLWPELARQICTAAIGAFP